MNIVKELCVRRGITQKELALTIGVSQPTASDWFNNKTDPSGKRLEKLSEVLGVSRAVILGYDNDPIASNMAVDLSGSMNKGKSETAIIIEEILAKLAKLDEEGQKEVVSFVDFKISQKNGDD